MTPAPINLGELERLCERALKAKGDNARWEALDRLEMWASPDRLLALTARLRAAEGALRPFAEAAETIVRERRAIRDVIITPADSDIFPAGQITWGHLRAAAKAVPPLPDTTTSSGE